MAKNYRSLKIPEIASGMRLDRFLARWFKERSRNELVKAIKEGQVFTPEGKILRPSSPVRAGEFLHITIPGIAPTGPPPAFPTIVYEDDELIIIDKPAGLICHPAGNNFTWAVIGLARDQWPEDTIDLVHRIDRDTSGLLMLTKNTKANHWYKTFIQGPDCTKEYLAIIKGRPEWGSLDIHSPIGPAAGPIRIQMATRDDGLAAHTEVQVLETHTKVELSFIQCRLHTGRTHQIRVHLASIGYPLLGDRMYGVPPEVFLHAWELGADESTFQTTGAPRHALHCSRLRLKRPSGDWIDVQAPLAPDINRWWSSPSCLPLDQELD